MQLDCAGNQSPCYNAFCAPDSRYRQWQGPPTMQPLQSEELSGAHALWIVVPCEHAHDSCGPLHYLMGPLTLKGASHKSQADQPCSLSTWSFEISTRPQHTRAKYAGLSPLAQCHLLAGHAGQAPSRAEADAHHKLPCPSSHTLVCCKPLACRTGRFPRWPSACCRPARTSWGMRGAPGTWLRSCWGSFCPGLTWLQLWGPSWPGPTARRTLLQPLRPSSYQVMAQMQQTERTWWHDKGACTEGS